MGGGGLHELLNTNIPTKTKNITHNFFSHQNYGSCNVNLGPYFAANFCSKKFKSYGFCCENVLGPVPSQIEVKEAIDDLHRLMMGITAGDSEMNGLQQMVCHHDPRMIQSSGYRRVYDAYHMLQTQPPVQRMVISISSDKAVWDAIVCNKAVLDLQGSLHTARQERPVHVRGSSEEELDFTSLLMKWILGMAKFKVVELIEKFGVLVNEIFKEAADEQMEKPTSELNNLLEEKVRSSLLLSVVILLIVVFTRTHEA